jgi:hypothetical protein
MSFALAFLLYNPLIPIAIWVVGIGVGIGIEQLRYRLRRRRSSRQYPPLARRPDAADQLRIVMRAEFAVQPLLNKAEARVLRELERAIEACNPNWQVMAQVSLGEILRSKDPDAFSCINSKRVDLLLIDGNCVPRHAIEYQGTGHYQGSAAARDAVKKEALRRAGIGYHEVVAGHTTPQELRQLVGKLVGRPNVGTVPASASKSANPWAS